MGFIHCCGGLRNTRTFKLAPHGKFVVCEVDYLKKCPVCGQSATQLTRIDKDDNISVVKKTKAKAEVFLKRLKKFFLYEETKTAYKGYMHKKFYLNYNEYGVKKRCYSNLSTLQLGKYDNETFSFKDNSYPIKTI